MSFGGGQYGSAPVLTNLTDNFGISAWVKVRSLGGNRAIAYNGDTGNNGWGLFQVGNTFQGLFGNAAFIGSAPVQTNVWTHLALVRDQGMTTLYVNGAACGSNSAAPISPNGLFALASSPASLSGEFFDGLIDEVAVFTFAPGAFTTNDLAYLSPDSRTLSAALNGTNIAITWPAVRSDLQLQYTTDLSSGVWTSMPYTTNNNQYVAADDLGSNARFYRLIKPAFDSSTPILTMINLVNFRSNGQILTNSLPLDTTTPFQLNSQTSAYAVDASQTMNPRTGTEENLSFHWIISYPTINPYTDAGITHYHNSILQIAQNAMAQGSATFTLDVRDNLDASIFREDWVVLNATDKALSLTIYSACQQPGATVCPTCKCTDAEALPASDPNDPP